jgi:hypothetical protein
MSDLRKAAQMALEAFTGLLTFNPTYDDYENGRVAVDALRAALAQPIISPEIKGDKTQLVVGGNDLPTLTKWTPQPAPPDPVEVREGWEYMREKGLLQEPWNEHPIDTDTTRGPMLMTVGDTLARAGFIKKPKPLTDEEVYALVDATIGNGRCEFARDIEKAHGIGGEE